MFVVGKKNIVLSVENLDREVVKKRIFFLHSIFVFDLHPRFLLSSLFSSFPFSVHFF
jgi:hypothetical protein